MSSCGEMFAESNSSSPCFPYNDSIMRHSVGSSKENLKKIDNNKITSAELLRHVPNPAQL